LQKPWSKLFVFFKQIGDHPHKIWVYYKQIGDYSGSTCQYILEWWKILEIIETHGEIFSTNDDVETSQPSKVKEG
jgi:hypothetical protein